MWETILIIFVIILVLAAIILMVVLVTKGKKVPETKKLNPTKVWNLLLDQSDGHADLIETKDPIYDRSTRRWICTCVATDVHILKETIFGYEGEEEMYKEYRILVEENCRVDLPSLSRHISHVVYVPPRVDEIPYDVAASRLGSGDPLIKNGLVQHVKDSSGSKAIIKAMRGQQEVTEKQARQISRGVLDQIQTQQLIGAFQKLNDMNKSSELVNSQQRPTETKLIEGKSK